MVHKDLSQGRWSQLSLAEQMGNIGSEYYRARKWREQNDTRFQSAFDRLLELLDLSITNSHLTPSQRKELSRIRESVCEEMTENTQPGEYLQKYFDYFALAARSR